MLDIHFPAAGLSSPLPSGRGEVGSLAPASETGHNLRLALAAFLRRSAGERFVWGGRDCCLWAVEWIIEMRGVDPAASLRGTYDDARACARILAAYDGVVGIAREYFAAAGLAETDAPELGDVVAVRATDAKGRASDALGILTASAGRVACKAPIGITVAPWPIVAAWSI